MTSNREFSEATKRQLLDVLDAKFDGDAGMIDEIMSELEFAKEFALDGLPQADPKQIKSIYADTLQKIRSLESTLDDFGIMEIETLDDLLGGYDDDEELEGIWGREVDPKTGQLLEGQYGLTIWGTRLRLKALTRALDIALHRIKILKGAKPKRRQRELAFYVRESLENLGVSLSHYDDGLYFNILEILFDDCFGDCGSDAHRRHGTFALSIDRDSDDHGIMYLPAGTVVTEKKE